jgi:hypothetical protein
MEKRKRIDLVTAKLMELADQGLDGSITVHLRKGCAEKVEVRTISAVVDA